MNKRKGLYLVLSILFFVSIAFAASIKISDMPSQTVLSSTDLFVIAQEDTSNKKITWANILNNLPFQNYISGLVPSNDTDADHDISISAGCAFDSTNANWMILSSAIVKQIDAAWAVGTNQGGLDGTESSGGTPDASTLYNLFLIYRSDTGVVDWCYSENSAATGPSRDGTPIPAAYDYWRWIGWVLTDGSANIYPFYCQGNDVMYLLYMSTPSIASGLNQTSFTAQSVSSFYPTGSGNILLLHLGFYFGSTGSVTISHDGTNGVDGADMSVTTTRVTLISSPNGDNIYYKVSSGDSATMYAQGVLFKR